jgi:hypothetical protein
MMTGMSSGEEAPEGVTVTRPSWISSRSRGVDQVRIVTGVGEVLVRERVKDGGEVAGDGAESARCKFGRVADSGFDILFWNGRVKPEKKLKTLRAVMAVRFMVACQFVGLLRTRETWKLRRRQKSHMGRWASGQIW